MKVKTYEIVSLFLVIVVGALVAFVVVNRNSFIETVTKRFNGQNNNYPGLVEKYPKVDSKWLQGNNYLRDTKLLVKEGVEPIVYASNLNNPSQIEVVENFVFITEPNTGNLVVLEDKDFDNSADSSIVFDSNLQNPYGLSFYNGDLYVAVENGVLVYKEILSQVSENIPTYQVLLSGLPYNGLNSEKSIEVVGEVIYLSYGSSCDYCLEEDKRRGSVVAYSLDGTTEEIYSLGLRRVTDMEEVGFTVVVSEQSVESVEGVNDEINVLKKGAFFGWPKYFGENVELIEFDDTLAESNPQVPDVVLPYDFNPLGLAYNLSENLLFVSNKNSVVSFNFTESTLNTDEYFVLQSAQNEPKFTDIELFRSGYLVSDSNNGVIYFIN